MALITDALNAQVTAKWQESFNRLNHGREGIVGLMSASQAWESALAFLKVDIPTSSQDDEIIIPTLSSLRSLQRPRDPAEAVAAFNLLAELKLLPALMEHYLTHIQSIGTIISVAIRQHLKGWEENYTTEGPVSINRLIAYLVQLNALCKPMSQLGTTMVSAYNTAFQTQLYSRLPPEFVLAFKQLIAWTLAIPEGMKDINHPELSDPELWSNFEALGLVDRYEMLIASVCYEHVEAKIASTCTGVWDRPMLKEMRAWMARDVVGWMLKPYARGAKTMEEARSMLQGVGSRFDFHICKVLCDLRTKEIFDIIIDYPDSLPALQDLKECLFRVDQRQQLVQSLRKANKKRLLHPGADTRDILSQYVSMIRCLRIVDPPGVLLFKVADPIRRFLRDRPDTIRCIVASLVGDDSTGDSLVDENEPIQPLTRHVAEDYSEPNWEPDPVDAGPDFRANKPTDVISTLVSIYPSHDLFVKELQVLLAQRLLAIKDGNFTRERRNLELLKVRFGEAQVQVCEVMMKDMADSKRIDQHMQSVQTSVLRPTIISEHFWPALASSKLCVPSMMKSIQEEYDKQFVAFKPDKKLRWLPHLGTVTIEVELDDRTVEAEVTPLEAAILENFNARDIWDIGSLVEALGGVDRTIALTALSTWEELGVIRQDDIGTYRLLNTREAKDSRRVVAPLPKPAIDDIPTIGTAQQQQAEQMRVYWKFIEGMLKNLGSLPLQRIQMMLKMTVPGYDKTPEQLGSFLEAAKDEGLLTARDGKWRLA